MQARLLDLLRGPVVELNLAVVIVTHDLGVARLLADRLLVMKQGGGESGLTDRVLDDPAPSRTPSCWCRPYCRIKKANMIRVQKRSKTFVLHQQNGVRLPVLQNASLGGR